MLNLSPLLKLFNQIPAYTTLVDALYWGELAAGLYRPLGLLTAARPALLAALQADLQRPILFITARADRARILTEQIQTWAKDPATVYRLPDPGSLPHEKVAWGHETIQERLAALSTLVVYKQNLQQSLEKVKPEKININTATVEELMELPEIGWKRALGIVEYREAHGQFQRLEDVIRVKGIGPKTFDKIKDKIRL